MNKTRICCDPYSSPESVGSLTEKKEEALEKCLKLSPGYEFVLLRYAGRGSRATHVSILKNEEEVGLVGEKNTAQYYDNNPETEKVVKRVANRVYKRSVRF
jgi:hypothetical protein